MSTSSVKTARETRLSIRANAAQKELLKRAARARNTDLSKFVLEASLGEAKRLIADESVLILSSADYQQLCSALDEPALPNAELQRLLGQKRVWDE